MVILDATANSVTIYEISNQVKEFTKNMLTRSIKEDISTARTIPALIIS